jgi:predicted lipoprotein
VKTLSKKDVQSENFSFFTGQSVGVTGVSGFEFILRGLNSRKPEGQPLSGCRASMLSVA